MRVHDWMDLDPPRPPPKRIPANCEAQVVGAYKLMAEKAKYRPGAPSDGFGHITVDLDELDLDEEAREYAQRFWDAEEDLWWWIGCANYSQRVAMVYLVEAARACCSADPDLARKLTELAAEELKDQKTKKAW